DQADLSGADSFADRAERRRFVFEALRATADESQSVLLRRVERSDLPHQAFWLVNMIAVDADRATAEELAARPEVSSIAPNRPAPFSRPETPERVVAPLAASAVEASLEQVHATSLWNLGYTGQG